MKEYLGIFTDKGEFSWRKIMTAFCVVTFTGAQWGYLIFHRFDELPAAYMAIDASVFGFYFLRRTLENIKMGTTDKQ